jgi:hypothetical protein
LYGATGLKPHILTLVGNEQVLEIFVNIKSIKVSHLPDMVISTIILCAQICDTEYFRPHSNLQKYLKHCCCKPMLLKPTAFLSN